MVLKIRKDQGSKDPVSPRNDDDHKDRSLSALLRPAFSLCILLLALFIPYISIKSQRIPTNFLEFLNQTPSHPRQPDPTLVIYVYSGSDPEYATNLRFFIHQAIKVRTMLPQLRTLTTTHKDSLLTLPIYCLNTATWWMRVHHSPSARPILARSTPFAWSSTQCSIHQTS